MAAESWIFSAARAVAAAARVRGLSVASAAVASHADHGGEVLGRGGRGFGGGDAGRCVVARLLVGRQRRDQVRARELGRGQIVLGDDDARADIGDAKKILREGGGEADAAVRSRIARDHALVHGDARVGDALHERHRRAAVEVGVVVAVLLENGEDAGGRIVAGHAAGDRRGRDLLCAVINRHGLLADGDDDHQRTRRLRQGRDDFLAVVLDVARNAAHASRAVVPLRVAPSAAAAPGEKLRFGAAENAGTEKCRSNQCRGGEVFFQGAQPRFTEGLQESTRPS